MKFFKLTWTVLIVALSTIGLSTSLVQAKDIKVNLLVGPNEPTYKGWIAAKKYIEDKSGGTLEVKVFHSGQLGKQQTRIVDVQQGQYDAAGESPAKMSSLYKPIGVFGAPYIFRDASHMKRVFASDIGQNLLTEFEKKSDIKVLDTWYYGTRHLTSNILGVTPEELSKVKMRIYSAPIAYEFANALGTVPTPVAFNELYMALKTGAVDGQENPIPTIHAKKFYEVQKHLILTGHVIGPFVQMMNMDTWNGLSAEDQKIVLEGVKYGGTVADAIVIEKEQSLIADLEKKGMTVTTPPNVDLFRERAQKAYKNYEADWGAGVVDKIVAIQ